MLFNSATISPTKKAFIVLFLISFLFVNFLFFIDEGYYDFRWMRSWGNWLVFLIYLLPIFGLQMLAFVGFQKVAGDTFSLIVSAITGTALGTIGVLILLS